MLYAKTKIGIPNRYPGVYELKWSCGSVYNGETKKKIISGSIKHQQESIKGHLLEQPNTERNVTAISTGYTPKLSSLKIDSMIEKWGNC